MPIHHTVLSGHRLPRRRHFSRRGAGMFSSIEDACDSMIKIKKIYKPDPANHELYLREYKKYKKLFSALEQLFNEDKS